MKKSKDIFLGLLAISLIFSSIILLYDNNKDELQMKKKIETLRANANISIDTVPISESNKDETEGEINWQYLKELNPDIIGWIVIPGTNINYPLLKGKTNQYYERRMYDKSGNKYGSIYMDYRNDEVGIAPNTIIYGHNTTNHLMFADLTNYLAPGFLEMHPYLYIYTESKTIKGQILLAYATQEYEENIYLIDVDIKQYMDMVKKDIKKEESQGEIIEFKGRGNLITLSTCSFAYRFDNPKQRIIVHATII